MSIHAQIEGGPTLEFPDGTDPQVVQATVKKVIAGNAPKAPAGGFDPVSGADIAASVATGGVASLAGGVVKAGAALNKTLGLDKVLGTEGFDFEHGTEKLEDMLTWSPKTDKGKAVMADVARGLKAFESWSDKQGEKNTAAVLAAGDRAAEVAKSLGAPQAVVDFIDRHKEQVAAAYGSATKTSLNAAPMLLGGELARGVGRVGELAKPREVAPPAAAAPTTTTPLSVEPGAPRAAPTPLAAATEGAVLRETIAPTDPKVRAEAYVRDRLGLSWDAISDRTKAKLTAVAADARALDRLNPDAVKRQATLEGLKVPVTTTAGKLNRDPAQLLREQGAAATPSGQPIRDIDVAANRDLRRNVEVLIDRLKGVGASKAGAVRGEKAGEAISGTDAKKPGALTTLQAQAKARTRAAYERARSTDPEATVAPDAMYGFVRGNPEVLNPAIQHLSWLNSWLKKAGIEKLDEEGKATGEMRPIKLTELDDLRKKAGKMAGGTGDSAHYAKEVLGAIDQTFEQLPDSAKAWKAAREAHKEERGTFANQGAIARLVDKKGGQFGTDPKTALEDVWKVSVKNASLEDVRTIKRTLLSGQDAATRVEGRKALRTLRAATAQNLLDEITKNVSTNERGEANITAESINNWIKGIGQDGTFEGGVEKLNVVWGRRATQTLLQIREAAQIAKTEPTVRNVGSNTFQKILNWMDDTGFGKLVKGVGGGPLVHLGEMAVKQVEKGRAVSESSETATSAGERAGASAAASRAKKIQEQQTKRVPTYGAP